MSNSLPNQSSDAVELIAQEDRSLMRQHAHERDLASYSQEQDLYKHLATLSTGSILLLVTFLEKLFVHPQWKAAVVTALIGFTVSIIGSVGMQLLSVLHVNAPAEGESGLTTTALFVVATASGFGGFLTGIVALVAFALKNL